MRHLSTRLITARDPSGAGRCGERSALPEAGAGHRSFNLMSLIAASPLTRSTSGNLPEPLLKQRLRALPFLDVGRVDSDEHQPSGPTCRSGCGTCDRPPPPTRKHALLASIVSGRSKRCPSDRSITHWPIDDRRSGSPRVRDLDEERVINAPQRACSSSTNQVLRDGALWRPFFGKHLPLTPCPEHVDNRR